MTGESYAGKAVVVTGASSGIGKAIALRLADEGASVALAARDAQRLEALAAECGRRGGKAIGIPTDVAEEAQCRALIERSRETYGRIDMLVNNAGIDVVAKLDELRDLRLFQRVMDVNFYGTVSCTYYALPHLKETRGRLVNVSSIGGLLAVPFNTSYIASKFAVNGFSESLRTEVAGAGVSVTVICPSWVATEFHERYMDKDGCPKGPSGQAIYTKKTMTSDRCAQIVLRAARARRREVILGPARPGLFLRLVAPGLLDKITISAFLRPAVERIEGKSGASL